jgi:predicted aspartyl protease
LLSIWLGTAKAEAPCTLKQVAALQTDISHGLVLTTIQIDGRDARVLVDTGSPFNMISPRLAAELKLPERAIREGAALDISGKAIRHMVNVHKVGLGGMTAEDIPFLVLGENSDRPSPIDGIFGANFLESYDVELDLAHGKINLFLPNDCPAEPVYWTRDYAVSKFQTDASLHAVLHVTLDGQELRAVFDTGATHSVLSAQTARRLFNLDPDANGDKPDGELHGGTGAPLPFYRHRFADFEIGGVAFHNTEFAIVSDKLSRIIREHQPLGPHAQSDANMETQVAIGLHHLARLRAYIAFHEQRLYISAADAK